MSTRCAFYCFPCIAIYLLLFGVLLLFHEAKMLRLHVLEVDLSSTALVMTPSESTREFSIKLNFLHFYYQLLICAFVVAFYASILEYYLILC